MEYWYDSVVNEWKMAYSVTGWHRLHDGNPYSFASPFFNGFAFIVRFLEVFNILLLENTFSWFLEDFHKDTIFF